VRFAFNMFIFNVYYVIFGVCYVRYMECIRHADVIGYILIL